MRRLEAPGFASGGFLWLPTDLAEEEELALEEATSFDERSAALELAMVL